MVRLNGTKEEDGYTKRGLRASLEAGKGRETFLGDRSSPGIEVYTPHVKPPRVTAPLKEGLRGIMRTKH